MKLQKIMLIYPLSKLYQRGEDRSQGNVDDSTSTSMRACNDLGYGAATLKEKGLDIFLRDYQTENSSFQDLEKDFRTFQPDVLMMSITNATIFNDIEIVTMLKSINNSLTVILKGALFFDPDMELLEQLDLKNIDYLIGGESDFVLSKLIDCHFRSIKNICNVEGILYKENNQWHKTDFSKLEVNLDCLPFPDRSMMKNSLYVRPDTGEPQATIATSRGCSSNCVYCLTPKISGRSVRLRSPANIIDEMLECYRKYKIRNFFFKSDTFTAKPDWVAALCDGIRKSEMHGDIQWVANSRTRPLNKETLRMMKESGCWLVAFGFESGHSETMTKIKKGATVEDNIKAAQYAKDVGLKIFGFYLVGFPWEGIEHLKATEDLIFKVNADFIELHLAIPYYGTPLYKMAQKEGLVHESILGRDYFNPPVVGTKYISFQELVTFRKKLLLKYHMRPSFIFNKLKDAVTKPVVLKNYVKFGSKLLWQQMR